MNDALDKIAKAMAREILKDPTFRQELQAVLRTSGASTPVLDDAQLLRPKDVAKLLTVNRSTIWVMVQAGKFPKPIQLTPARIAWRRSTVIKWLEERERNRLAAFSYPRTPRSK